MTQSPVASVIIPHFNDWARLELCLDALSQQTISTEQFEIIVVDNGSAESGEARLDIYPHVRLLTEPIASSYRARNTGIQAAKTEIFAFTDSDCIPAQDWLEKGIKRLQNHPDLGFVAGRIDLFPANPEQVTPAERFDLLRAFPIETYMKHGHFGTTANLFTRRSVIDKIGPFDETLKSNGDREWCTRAHSAGYPVEYGPDVLVAHPARQTVGEIWKKARRVGGGEFDRYIKTNSASHYYVDRNGFIADVIPPIRTLLEIWKTDHLSPLQRFQLIGIEAGYKYGKTLEKVRLSIGGTSTRS